MNSGTVVKGIFIALIGFVVMMGCLEGEPAMIEFVNGFGFSAVEGIGLGTTVSIIGIVIALVGLGSKKS